MYPYTEGTYLRAKWQRLFSPITIHYLSTCVVLNKPVIFPRTLSLPMSPRTYSLLNNQTFPRTHTFTNLFILAWTGYLFMNLFSHILLALFYANYLLANYINIRTNACVRACVRVRVCTFVCILCTCIYFF